ncbi:hypothetical protein MW887_000514 [Aspergillus wentii]|nr:hypothetical protein MW887_000514 [Aspergillus wentii]
MRWPLLLPFFLVDSFALSHSTSSCDVELISSELHDDESDIVRPRAVCPVGENKHDIAPSTRIISNRRVDCLDEGETIYARNEVHDDPGRTSSIPSDIKDIESLVNWQTIDLSLLSNSKINQHWRNLQILKSKVDDLQRQIEEEEHEILNILTQEDQGSQLASFTVLPSSYPQYGSTYWLGVCALVLLVGALFTFVSKFLFDSTNCLRRRVDRAARREERRTRRAYRIAARHLKWRKWWEGSSLQSMPNPSTDDTLGEVQQDQQSETGSTLPIEPNAIQTEISGFIQTLN